MTATKQLPGCTRHACTREHHIAGCALYDPLDDAAIPGWEKVWIENKRKMCLHPKIKDDRCLHCYLPHPPRRVKERGGVVSASRRKRKRKPSAAPVVVRPITAAPPPASRARGPDTSKDAAAIAALGCKELREQCYGFILSRRKTGATPGEVIAFVDPTGVRPEHAIRPRITELQKHAHGALIVRTDLKRKNLRGNDEYVYVAHTVLNS